MYYILETLKAMWARPVNSCVSSFIARASSSTGVVFLGFLEMSGNGRRHGAGHRNGGAGRPGEGKGSQARRRCGVVHRLHHERRRPLRAALPQLRRRQLFQKHRPNTNVLKHKPKCRLDFLSRRNFAAIHFPDGFNICGALAIADFILDIKPFPP